MGVSKQLLIGSMLLVLAQSGKECEPLLYPRDLPPLAPDAADDRMHRAISLVGQSPRRLRVLPGRHSWCSGRDLAAEMPEAPRRLSMRSSSSSLHSTGNAQVLLAHAAALRDGVSHFPVMHQWHGALPARMLREPDESVGAYWFRWWSGKEVSVSNQGEEEGGPTPLFPNLLNTDCHVFKSWRVTIESQGGISERDATILEGSWKILDGAEGSMSNLSLENSYGSVLELWNATWCMESCRVACKGPWEVAPVCIFAWRGAYVELRTCTLERLAGPSGTERSDSETDFVAHNGIVLQDACCNATGCSFANFSSSDVYIGNNSKLFLLRCHLSHSSYSVHFGKFTLADLSLISCEFRDPKLAAFLATPNRRRDEKLTLTVKACKLLGRLWDQDTRCTVFVSV